MNSTSFDPLEKTIWRRGARLGLVWLALFFASAAALYGVLGLLGWQAAWRALCAMFVGPLVGTVIIAGWWLVRRPRWDVGARGELADEVTANDDEHELPR